MPMAVLEGFSREPGVRLSAASMGMDQEIILYGMGSPNVRKIGLMLEDWSCLCASTCGRVPGEQFTPEFLALNRLVRAGTS